MKCPFCRRETTDVINSRPTHHQTHIWRRRGCQYCHHVFTTYERPEVGFIKIVKKSGQRERYSRAKLYSGIYGAYLRIKNKERVVDAVTDDVEAKILDQKKAELSSQEVAEIVLRTLKTTHTGAFLRFLAYQADLETPADLIRVIRKHLRP